MIGQGKLVIGEIVELLLYQFLHQYVLILLISTGGQQIIKDHCEASLKSKPVIITPKATIGEKGQLTQKANQFSPCLAISRSSQSGFPSLTMIVFLTEAYFAFLWKFKLYIWHSGSHLACLFTYLLMRLKLWFSLISYKSFKFLPFYNSVPDSSQQRVSQCLRQISNYRHLSLQPEQPELQQIVATIYSSQKLSGLYTYMLNVDPLKFPLTLPKQNQQFYWYEPLAKDMLQVEVRLKAIFLQLIRNIPSLVAKSQSKQNLVQQLLLRFKMHYNLEPQGTEDLTNDGTLVIQLPFITI